MYYLFSPLLEDGVEAMRHAECGEFIDMMIGDNKQILLCHQKTLNEWPILTMKRFEEDPLGEIKRIHELYNQQDHPWETLREISLWQAIVKTMERLEGK